MENDTADSEKLRQSEVDSIDRDADFSSLDGSDEIPEDRGTYAAQTGSGDDTERLRSELKETNDKYLRALADLENYKKRTLKERSDLLKYQGEKVFVDLLEVVDNLEFALQYSGAPELPSEPPAFSPESAEKLRQGLVLIHKLFLNILGKWEVRPESALGKLFDPQHFSAISKVPTTDVEPGTVISELKKAYFYKDRMLRPGEVVVADAAPTANEAIAEENGDS